MKKYPIFVSLALLLGAGSQAWAAAFDPLPIGARANAMGGAYTALAEDPSAVYWNPAGLVNVKRPSFTFSHLDIQTLGLLTHDYAAYAQPFVFNNVIAVAWTRMGTTPNVTFMNYSENTFTLSYQQPVFKDLSLGANVKVMQVLYENSGGGVGFDLGARYQVQPFLAVGLMAENVNQPKIAWVTRAEDILPANLRMGLAGYITPDATVAFDADRLLEPNVQLHLGAEHWSFGRVLALRAGVTYLSAENRFLPSAGASLRLSYFEFAYAYSAHYDLDGNHVLTVQWGF